MFAEIFIANRTDLVSLGFTFTFARTSSLFRAHTLTLCCYMKPFGVIVESYFMPTWRSFINYSRSDAHFSGNGQPNGACDTSRYLFAYVCVCVCVCVSAFVFVCLFVRLFFICFATRYNERTEFALQNSNWMPNQPNNLIYGMWIKKNFALRFLV